MTVSLNLRSKLARRALAVAVPTAAAAGLLLGPVAGANAASADTGATLQVCASTGTDYVQFPDRGDMESTLINPGTCWNNYLGSVGTETVNVFRIDDNGLESLAWSTQWDASYPLYVTV